MKSHPILFSAPMIRALLAGKKTVTRRMSKQWLKVKAGDELWCRETWRTRAAFDGLRPAEVGKRVGKDVRFEADGSVMDISGCREEFVSGKIRASIHMPRWASRITLEATEDARLERLHDITEEDAVAEGMQIVGPASTTDRGSFAMLWDSLHGKDAPWSSNPGVIRLAFKVKA